jgi:hypothetical protein
MSLVEFFASQPSAGKPRAEPRWLISLYFLPEPDARILDQSDAAKLTLTAPSRNPREIATVSPLNGAPGINDL